MRIVLSRKGFDSAAGGAPSPVLKGKMLSLPIPEKAGKGDAPDDLGKAQWQKYDKLNLPSEVKKYCRKQSVYCHLDPDIREDFYNKKPQDWRPAFGQCGAAGGHLIHRLNLQRETNDFADMEPVLFLFFGLFRDYTHRCGDYKKNFDGEEFHAIWGYMVARSYIVISSSNKEKCFSWHPHTKMEKHDNNILFIGEKDECGTFGYCDELVLTDLNLRRSSKSKWKINALPWFNRLKDGSVNMSYHLDTNKCFPADDRPYFQSRPGYGQEFVVSPGTEITAEQDLSWKNCSFRDILENLQKIYS